MKKFFGLLVLLVATNVSAQFDDRYTLSATSDLTAASGQQSTISVNLDSVTSPTTGTAAVNLQGWSYGLCSSNSAVAAVNAVADGATSATVNNGAAPAFNSMNIMPMPGDGFTIGVVIDLFGNFTLAPGTGYEINVATYDVNGAGGDFCDLDFCDTLATPPVETLIVEMGGASAIPVQQGGRIEIPGMVTDPELFAGSGMGGNGDQVAVQVTMNNPDPVEGFSFGLVHDAANATLASIDEGAAFTAAVAGGTSFFHSDIAPTLPVGVSGGGFVGAVVSLTPPFNTIPSGMGQEVASFTYSLINTGMSQITTPLDFSGDVGDPAVALIVSINGGSATPLVNSGSLTIDAGPPIVLFLRGDANDDGAVDVSDVVYLAKALFNEPGFALVCDAAGDVDDNDSLDQLADPMYLLAYLFQGGPAPVAPFPVCGADPTTGTVGCAGTSFCP